MITERCSKQGCSDIANDSRNTALCYTHATEARHLAHEALDDPDCYRCWDAEGPCDLCGSLTRQHFTLWNDEIGERYREANAGKDVLDWRKEGLTHLFRICERCDLPRLANDELLCLSVNGLREEQDLLRMVRRAQQKLAALAPDVRRRVVEAKKQLDTAWGDYEYIVDYLIREDQAGRLAAATHALTPLGILERLFESLPDSVTTATPNKENARAV